jgi:hypothetical protein
LEKLLIGVENDIRDCETIEQRTPLYASISRLQGDINKIQDMLLKIEDRMFLNAAARIKSIPKKEKKELDPFTDLLGN